MSDKPWRDDLGEIAEAEKREEEIREDDLIFAINKFLDEYDTFYESWLNAEMSQVAFHTEKDKRIKDFSIRILERTQNDKK